QPVDQPAVERLHPGLKQNEERERDLDVGELPAGARLQRLDEQRPGILQIRDHDHRDQRGDQLEPLVVQLHPERPCPTVRRSVRPTFSSSSLTQPYTARVAGIGTPSRSPSSRTAPTTASISMGRPASRSCSIEVLCAPTFSAPAMRWSIEIGISIPIFPATASTSLM